MKTLNEIEKENLYWGYILKLIGYETGFCVPLAIFTTYSYFNGRTMTMQNIKYIEQVISKNLPNDMSFSRKQQGYPTGVFTNTLKQLGFTIKDSYAEIKSKPIYLKEWNNHIEMCDLSESLGNYTMLIKLGKDHLLEGSIRRHVITLNNENEIF